MADYIGNFYKIERRLSYLLTSRADKPIVGDSPSSTTNTAHMGATAMGYFLP